MNQIPNIEECKDSYKGKLWSTAVQKCFEAPFPEVAIQHLLMRIDEKHHQQLQSIHTSLVAAVEGDKKSMSMEINISNEYKLGYRQALNDTLTIINSIFKE